MNATKAGDVTHGPLDFDWSQVQAETAQHLQRLIRFDTTNPPGNELQPARYLEKLLVAAGIEAHLFEPDPDRGAVVARIPGTGERRGAMLLAHLDVVGVQREHWSVDPFGGEIRDGYVYGRGAIDDKGMLACNLVTMLLLQRWLDGGAPRPSRDVIFVASADEEEAGTFGIQWLIDNHPDLLAAEFALNEGGRIRIVGDRPLYAAVQTAEKVSHLLTLTARGPAGHAAIPLPDNAVARLGGALAAVSRHREPVTLLATTRRFFAQLATVWQDEPQAAAMADLVSDDAARADDGARVLATIPAFDALLRSGISPTIVRGGSQANVIPAEAEAVLGVRTLPGDSIEEIAARLSTLIDDPRIEVTVTDRGADAPTSAFDSPMFQAIEAAVAALDPSILTVPYLSTGASDSARLRRWGMDAYGLLPFPLAEADEKRMHGHDERVPLQALGFGTRLVCETIRRVAWS